MASATAALAERDAVMAGHIARVGPCALKPRSGGRSHFEALARSIAYQQLAGKAAASIWGRVRALVDGAFEADAVLALSDGALRGAGLSTNKTRSLQDLALHVADGRLPLHRLSRQEDEMVVEELIQVRGIGRWTAEMFLIFQLGRLDVWPIGDYGVRNGYRKLYGLAELPTVQELAQYGEPFRPYRSVAAWYCWRAADVAVPATV